jgi:hypothetical protein
VKSLLVIALLGGCDFAWSIDHVGMPKPDGPVDVATLDLPPGCERDDEDCDHVPNAIDQCPADFDTPSDDVDSDMVGNLCDPAPSTPGDHIVFFDPFIDGSRGWTITGAWKLGNGALTQTVTGDGRATLAVTPSAFRATFYAVFNTVDVLDGGAIGIFGAQANTELRCQVFTRSGVETLHMEGFFINGDTPLAGSGPIYISGGQLRDGRLYCRARHGTDLPVQTMSGPLSPVMVDHVGLFTSNASASYTSAMLLDVP